MNIKPTYLEAIQSLGYTEREARFMYIAATHSGYFTQRQYTRFTATVRGRPVTDLTAKLLGRRHAREETYHHGGHVYHLFARALYRAIAKEHIRARHRHSLEHIRTRLAALEFVLSNLQPDYLETEKEKVEFFYLNYGIEPTHLPKKVYKGHTNSPNTTRYFVDKFPMFLTQDSSSYEPLLTFTFVDPGRSVQSSFVTHLEWYSGLFARLQRFNFVYVGTAQSSLATAEVEFTKRVRTTPPNAIQRLIRYFQLRELEDTKQYSKIALTDLEFIGQAKKIFAGDPFDSIYHRWRKNEIWDSEISQELNDHYGGKQVNFATFLLAQDPLHFEQNSWFYRPRSVTT